MQRRELIRQQDCEYNESLRMDQRKVLFLTLYCTFGFGGGGGGLRHALLVNPFCVPCTICGLC